MTRAQTPLTVMVFPGTQTLPLFVYLKFEGSEADAAIVLSLVLVVVSLLVVVGLRDRWLTTR